MLVFEEKKHNEIVLFEATRLKNNASESAELKAAVCRARVPEERLAPFRLTQTVSATLRSLSHHLLAGLRKQQERVSSSKKERQQTPPPI
jgi:hypothetical protein